MDLEVWGGVGSLAWEFAFSLSITLACSLGDLIAWLRE